MVHTMVPGDCSVPSVRNQGAPLELFDDGDGLDPAGILQPAAATRALVLVQAADRVGIRHAVYEGHMGTLPRMATKVASPEWRPHDGPHETRRVASGDIAARLYGLLSNLLEASHTVAPSDLHQTVVQQLLGVGFTEAAVYLA